MRHTWWVLGVSSLFFVACSAAPEPFRPGEAAGSGGGQKDGGMIEAGSGGQGGAGSGGLDGGAGTGPVGCIPKTCGELGKDCGPVSDGCGGIVECGKCEAGKLCGILAHNQCTAPADLCKPLAKADACKDLECGLTSDGCGGTIDCGSCKPGFACGLETAFVCGALPVATPESCPAKIQSCASVGAECGKIGNGCGGIIDCNLELGGCEAGAICGIEEAQKCDTPPACIPLTPSQACAGKCGFVSNGCAPTQDDNGLIDCSQYAEYQCPQGQSCGAGGVANQCGDPAMGTCTPLTKNQACGNAQCGLASNGCDGSHVCGTCGMDEICQNGSCVPACTPMPKATACFGRQCGVVSDGCNGIYDCGTCAPGQSCGLVTPFQCASSPPPQCVPLSQSAACAGKQCGTVFDGCGGTHMCGSCAPGAYCGIHAPFQCGVPTPPSCTPASSCADLGWECGLAIDDCGTIFDCAMEGRSCNPQTETCMGGIGGTATQCVQGSGGPGGPSCGVCGAIANCSGQPQNTQLTGRVITPGKSDDDVHNQVGVPNAFVYILSSNDESLLPPVPSGIPKDGSNWLTACDRCDDQNLGPVLASATTDSTGAFTISSNVPVNQEFVLVVKIGKWRRAQKVFIPSGQACTTVTLPKTVTRLPRTRTDGLAVNIPRIAISTGRVDAMECVFHKMGVATSEFALPGTNGSAPERVHMYTSTNTLSNGNTARGAVMGSGSSGRTLDSELHGSKDRLNQYDLVVFDCEADTFVEPAASMANVREYVNRGGRMFASHFSFSWINGNGTSPYSAATFHDTGLSPSANPGTGSASSDTGYVSVNRPRANPAKVNTFAAWLLNEGAVTHGGGQYSFTITDPRDLAASVNTGSEEWVYRSIPVSGGTCNTCATASSQSTCEASPNCKWSNGSCTTVDPCTSYSYPSCPSGCSASFLTWSCSAHNCSTTSQSTCNNRYGCYWTPNPPNTPVQQYSFNTPYSAPSTAICGRVAYSGFHVAGSGTFNDVIFPNHCIGSGANNGRLTPQEKVLLYMLFDLSACVTSGGTPVPPACTALDPTTACQGACGVLPNGCGGTIQCGGCPGTDICVDNLCVPASCVPLTLSDCGSQGATCGTISDGCGGTVNCGDCQEGQVCGLYTPNQCASTCTPTQLANACAGKCGFVSNGCGGVHQCPACDGGLVCINNMCTTGSCTPLTSCPVGKNCGVVSDGCSGTVGCGDCTLPEVCGGGGQPNVCGQPMCNPLDCEDQQADCGYVGDGCGGVADFCGDCEDSQVCGLGGPNKCGGCVKRTCKMGECGFIGDGCGGAEDCGPCPAGQICGATTPNKCGTGPACKPLTCNAVGAKCGLIGDGCGGVADCGKCPSGQVCGLTTPNQCSAPPPCQKTSCNAAGAECGSIGDGCGGLLDCGACPPGKSCGLVSPNKCHGVD